PSASLPTLPYTTLFRALLARARRGDEVLLAARSDLASGGAAEHSVHVQLGMRLAVGALGGSATAWHGDKSRSWTGASSRGQRQRRRRAWRGGLTRRSGGRLQ